jgi:hypothetical protein
LDVLANGEGLEVGRVADKDFMDAALPVRQSGVVEIAQGTGGGDDVDVVVAA